MLELPTYITIDSKYSPVDLSDFPLTSPRGYRKALVSYHDYVLGKSIDTYFHNSTAAAEKELGRSSILIELL